MFIFSPTAIQAAIFPPKRFFLSVEHHTWGRPKRVKNIRLAVSVDVTDARYSWGKPWLKKATFEVSLLPRLGGAGVPKSCDQRASRSDTRTLGVAADAS